MNQQQKRAAPYKTNSEKPKHEYKVLENGDIYIKQTMVTESWWKANEFSSLTNEHKESLKNIDYQLSDKYKEVLNEQKSDVSEELKILEPLLKDAEEKTKVEYEKMRLEGMTINVRKAIEDKEPDQALMWIQNVWLRTKAEIQEQVKKNLTSDEMAKFAVLLQKLKRKGVQ